MHFHLRKNTDSFIFHTHITGKHSTTRVSETRAGSTILIPFFYSFADNQTQHDRALVLASICALCFEINYTNIVEFIFFFQLHFCCVLPISPLFFSAGAGLSVQIIKPKPKKVATVALESCSNSLLGLLYLLSLVHDDTFKLLVIPRIRL